jgi:high-affinity nickel-transport protein
VRRALSQGEWHQITGMVVVVVALHVAGFALLLSVAGGAAISVGVGLTAYVLGLRHAFDVDHIAAIDNTTRQLMSDGDRPLRVGFFFALGHSTVVFAFVAALAAGAGWFQPPALIGPVVSTTFLVAIGLLNLLLLRALVRDSQNATAPGGVMSRVLGRAMRAVDKPWKMYPLGCLFGLGFDTATEVALLVVASGSAAAGVPFYATLCLPLLFAAGMTLLDALDGIFMTVAYGWTSEHPARRRLYNVTITALSVAVALLVAALQAVALVGYVVVGVLAATLAGAVAASSLPRDRDRDLAVGDAAVSGR